MSDSTKLQLHNRYHWYPSPWVERGDSGTNILSRGVNITLSCAGGIGTLASASFSNSETGRGFSKASSNSRLLARWLLATDLAFLRNKLLRHNRSFLYSSSSLSWICTSRFATGGMVARFLAISSLLKPFKIPSFFVLAISLSLFS